VPVAVLTDAESADPITAAVTAALPQARFVTATPGPGAHRSHAVWALPPAQVGCRRDRTCHRRDAGDSERVDTADVRGAHGDAAG